MTTKAQKRKAFVFDRLQHRLLSVHLLHILTILLIFAGVVFVPLILKLEYGNLSFLEKQEVANQLLTMHYQVWPPLLLVFVLLVVHSAIVTHRIAGPFYRLRATLRLIKNGDLTVNVSFRKNDYLKEAAEDMNDLIAALRTTAVEIMREEQLASVALADLQRSINTGSLEDATQKSERIKTHLDSISRTVGYFKVGTSGSARKEEPTGMTALNRWAT